MITLSLMRREGRRYWECQWTDPVTGRKRTKSTATANRREAERFLGSLAHQLNTDQYQERRNATWTEICTRYETEVLDSLAGKTKRKFIETRNAMNELIAPKMGNAIDTSQISRFQSLMRKAGRAESTIKSRLSALRACLNWANEMEMIRRVPIFKMPKRTGKMKGRPITTEEFERMLAKVAAVITDPDYVQRWTFTLEGLWPSTLRLDEALRLSWDRSAGFAVDLTGKHPRFRIEALEDKSKKHRLLPMTPDFAKFLLKVPEKSRRGKVFRPRLPGQLTDEIRLDTCSKVISAIGEAAGVLVAENPPKDGETEPQKKWASAHDFRRACLKAWSKKLRPQQLKDLARHEDINTTMTFYVGEDFDDTEAAIWNSEASQANTQANTSETPSSETA